MAESISGLGSCQTPGFGLCCSVCRYCRVDVQNDPAIISSAYPGPCPPAQVHKRCTWHKPGKASSDREARFQLKKKQVRRSAVDIKNVALLDTILFHQCGFYPFTHFPPLAAFSFASPPPRSTLRHLLVHCQRRGHAQRTNPSCFPIACLPSEKNSSATEENPSPLPASRSPDKRDTSRSPSH